MIAFGLSSKGHTRIYAGRLDHKLRVDREVHHSIGPLCTQEINYRCQLKRRSKAYCDVSGTKTFLPGLGQRIHTRTNLQEWSDIERLQQDHLHSYSLLGKFRANAINMLDIEKIRRWVQLPLTTLVLLNIVVSVNWSTTFSLKQSPYLWIWLNKYKYYKFAQHTYLGAFNQWSRERHVLLRGPCKNGTGKELDTKAVGCNEWTHERLKPSGCRNLFAIYRLEEGPIAA